MKIIVNDAVTDIATIECESMVMIESALNGMLKYDEMAILDCYPDGSIRYQFMYVTDCLNEMLKGDRSYFWINDYLICVSKS